MSTDAQLWTTQPPQTDHHTSFTTVDDRHATAVYRYAHSVTGDPDTAQDLLQETFLTTRRRRDQLDLATDSLLGRLLVTCRNLVADHRRHSARRRTAALLDHDGAGRPGWCRPSASSPPPTAAWSSPASSRSAPTPKPLPSSA